MGMGISVGGVRRKIIYLTIKFNCLSHNTLRGAGGALLHVQNCVCKSNFIIFIAVENSSLIKYGVSFC